ncbi:MAG TPA: tetratricopeptide repeat protein [Verrucomicrobiae bacterium]|jgi:tetratricopeptide (TPR) repeat protein|nr:tetratricopeptide repeat protein [Verrucomicrobiae bacterium]
MPAKSATFTPPNRTDRWQAILPGLAIVLLVVVAYLPALHGQFIWDDDFHVLKNASLRSLSGLWRIWFEPGATQQYYPITYSSFWIDYHLWGMNPPPYHAENIFLHALNALLVWQLLRRLSVPGAWLGAALFALHPVCVESVAWVSERKNTLSGFFFLMSLFAAIEFWLPRRNEIKKTNSLKDTEFIFGPWKFYWLTLFLYLCALWCKTVTAGLPGVILVLAWWKRGRLRWKDALLVLPFLALGIGIGLLTVSIEHKSIVDAANLDEWKLSLPAKFFIAGRAFWFYLGKLCWPYPLIFIYPRWNIESLRVVNYLPLAAAVAGFALLWFKRRAWGRAPLAAAGYFVIVLFPALGFVNIFPFRYSFVADHFQYLATIGPLALAAAGISALLTRLPEKNATVKRSLAGALLLVMAVLTWRQTGIYRNLEVLWRDTLARNPGAWMAHDNLGRYLTGARRFDEAKVEYHKAIEIRTNDHVAYYDLGLEAAMLGNLDEAKQDFTKTLELCPTFATAHYEMGNVFTREGNLDEAIHEYKETLKAIPGLVLAHFNLANALARQGKLEDAVEEYKRTLEKDPDYAPAHATLGRIMASRGNVEGAIEHYQAALESDPNSLEALVNLANALVSKGQLDEAVTRYHEALQLDPNSPVIHFNLSVALAKQGNASEAEHERTEAQRLQAERSAAGGTRPAN